MKIVARALRNSSYIMCCWGSKCQDRLSSSIPSFVGFRLSYSKFYRVSSLSECGLLKLIPPSVWQASLIFPGLIVSPPLKSDSAVEDGVFWLRETESSLLSTNIQILRCLAEEEYATTKVGVYKFVNRYNKRGTISRASGSRQTTMLTADVRIYCIYAYCGWVRGYVRTYAYEYYG